MNKDTAKDYLPLVQALAEGKTIQHCKVSGEAGSDYWQDCVAPTFADKATRYRIKPEPSQESIEMASYLEEMAKSIREMKIQPRDITNTVSASGCGTIYNVTFIYSARAM